MSTASERFARNINFIFNYKNLKLDFYRNSCKRLYGAYIGDICNIEANIKEYIPSNDSNKKKKDEILKKIKDISMCFSLLNKKIDKSDSTVKFVYTEAEKLMKTADLRNIIEDSLDYKKSKILYNKLMHTKGSLENINNIFESAKYKIINIKRTLKTFNKDWLDTVDKELEGILDSTKQYNINKLKRAQQKFEESKEIKDFMYGKVHPKLAHLFSLDESVKLPEYTEESDIDKTERYELQTPFGSVWVGDAKYGNGRVISLEKDKENAPNYDKMYKELDLEFDTKGTTPKARKNAINYLIVPIIKYINQPLTAKQNQMVVSGQRTNPKNLFETIKHNYDILKSLCKEQKEVVAFLCGVLLLSESHEVRNPTGGTFERKAMKNVLTLAKNNCSNPFQVVFNRAQARYIPARNVTQAQDEVGKITGGQKQMQLLLKGKIPITAFLKNNEFNAENLKSTKMKFFNDYLTKVNKYLKDNSINIFSSQDIKFGEKNIKLGKKKISKLNSKAIKIIEKIEINLNFLLNKFCNTNDEKYMVEIKDFPDFPEGALAAQFKKLILEKNVNEINKLMNCSLE